MLKTVAKFETDLLMSLFCPMNLVLAIELLAACQALDLHKEKGPGITTTPPLEKVHMLVRQHTK